MKKILIFVLLLVFIVSCCVACGEDKNDSKSADNRIYLNSSNATTYLSISARTYGSDYSYGSYKTITSTVYVTGASHNYDYHNVRITISIIGSMTLGSARSSGTRYTQTLYCSLDIGGNGADSTKDFVTDLSGIMSSYGANAYSVTGLGYEIESITGYVEKV